MSEEATKADPNALDQRAAWNGSMGERWLSNHRLLDRLLAPFAERLVDVAGELSGRTILDVGCGTGEMAARFAKLAGSAGQVTGVDISEQLITHARSAHDHPSLQFVATDAAAIELTTPVDLVISRFGMMFFTEPSQAFAHLRSCVVGGGRLISVVWQAPELNEWVRRPLQAASSVIDLPPPPPANAPGPFALADAQRFETTLLGAGFDHVSFEPFEPSVGIGADASTTARFLLGVLPTGPLLDALPASNAERLVEAVAAALEEHDGVVRLGSAAHLVVAR